MVPLKAVLSTKIFKPSDDALASSLVSRGGNEPLISVLPIANRVSVLIACCNTLMEPLIGFCDRTTDSSLLVPLGECSVPLSRLCDDHGNFCLVL